MALAALFLSGTASVANQVVWQRALKVFLGGSEALCSMVVVLVFMLGLGSGAGLMGLKAGRIRHPLRGFAWLELALFTVNVGVAVLLTLDFSSAVYAVERLAVSWGMPLRLVYAAGALCMLLIPTILMGATLPIASEACQRQLGASRTSLIAVLFLLNTLGAALGAFGSSFFLLPYFGQRISLFTAASMNLLAGIGLLVASVRISAVAARRESIGQAIALTSALRLEEVLGAWLGFLSLGYEMYLFRLMALAHEPLPYTFATTLCFFLVFWSGGVFLASRARDRLRIAFFFGAALVAAMPTIYRIDRFEVHFSLFGGCLVYFLPCVCFGLLYGALVSRSARSWGYDVGRFYAFNTIGSCIGILFFTLVGYEIPHDYNAVVISLGLVGLLAHFVAVEGGYSASRRLALRAARGVAVIALAGIVAYGWTVPWSGSRGTRTFWGRDGVVEVRPSGDVLIDGLWHTRLSDGRSHIGSRFSWLMAVGAVFAHRDEPVTDAAVVGNGVGITAATLAKLPGIRVVAYEINNKLADVLEAYPIGTLGVAETPRIEIRWRDGRSGLALDNRRYDLIVSAPLYLRQAGSSLLLSREYMELIKRRLKESGVFVVYSREGVLEQALLVRRTVRSVFPYAAVLKNGLMTVASRVPIEITAESIEARLGRADPFHREVARYDRIHEGRGGLLGILQPKVLHPVPGDYVVTDDHPLVEYPAVARRLVQPLRGRGYRRGIRTESQRDSEEVL